MKIDYSKKPERKLMIVEISPILFADLLKTGEHKYKVISNGLPADVEVKSVAMDFYCFRINLLISHSSFKKVLEGAEIPHWPAIIVETI